MRESELNIKSPVEKLRSFLEFEDDEIAQMSPEEAREELRLLGINASQFSADLQARVSALLSDTELVSSSISQPAKVVRSDNTDLPSRSWLQQISHVVLRFFQFFSKTDREILPYCSRTARMSQTSLGALVFLVGVLASISSAFTVHLMLNSTVVPVIVGCLFGAIILLLDRELVSFRRKTTAIVPMFVLAVFIGLVLSAPLELKLFKPRINAELALMKETEARAILDRQGQANSLYEARINILQRDIREYRDGISRAMDAMAAEVLGKPARTGIAGRGTAYRNAERMKDEYESLLSRSAIELQEVQAARQQELDTTKKEAFLRSQNVADDLLSRREALERIQASSRSGFYTVWGFRLVVVLINISPLMLFLLMPTNDYMAILEAERRRAIARVHAIANAHLAQIEKDPSVSLPRAYIGFGPVKGQSESSMAGEQAMMA